MNAFSIRLRKLARQTLGLLAALFLSVMPAPASGPGPNGVNIGFDFNWNSGPPGYTASFIASTNSNGATLNNCVGAVTPTAQSCDFVFAYSIGGAAQQAVLPGGVYSTWTPPVFCDTHPSNSAPLTLFNCFNNNSFGQIFMASATGPLTAFSMNMTCLNPAGTPPTGLFAALYQVNAGGTTIPATPLATTPLNLSTCPTLTSWTGHTFSSADFASIPMNFSNVTLTAGNFYAVYFGGLVPGAPLPGAPAVTSVTPNSGPLAGGNTVTLAGSNFTGATSVTFGGVAATSFTVVSDTSITAVVPSAASAGAVSVIVTTSIGSNNANTLYSYVIPAPTVTSVTPSAGPLAGGNTVTIAGTGFTGATAVTFGGVAATSFTVVNDTSITATVPSSAASGAVSVRVTTPGGSNASNSLYTYSPVPTVTSVNPSSGPAAGGNTVTITGTGFTGATSVTFNGVAAPSFTVVNDTTITATAPSSAVHGPVFATTRKATAPSAAANGAVSVVVTTPGGSSAANSLYTYIPAPAVTSVNPSSGPPAGGNTVTITGTGFTGATSITFAGVAATSFTVVNDTTITATAPPSGAHGAISVVVTAPGGSNAANSLYTYSQAPTVTSVNPSSGPPAGGNTVTITGTGFTGATSVTFGGVAATSFSVVNDTTITAVVPRNSTAGPVSVVVTTVGGSNAPNSLYSYGIPTPTLSEWGMIVLAGLLALFVWIRFRREDRTPAY